MIKLLRRVLPNGLRQRPFWHNHSLRFRLILSLSLTALFTWTLSTAAAWFQVRNEVNQVFDAQQILFAERLASSDLRMILTERIRTGGFRGEEQKHFKKPHFDDDALAFAVFTHRGEMLISDGRNGENFIFNPTKGFSDAHIMGDEDRWRIYWQPIGDGRLVIAVGQERDYRDDLVNEMVFGQMWIWFASLPILIGVLIFFIRKELASLQQLGDKVKNRKPDDFNQLSTQHVPTEILPIIDSLNHFFHRTSDTLLRERRFTSDAAHELRSPLSALRIQTELAQMAGDDTEMREQALRNLTLGIDRASQLIEQLLTLSRLDSLNQLEDLQPLDWQQIITSLVGELYFSAQKRQIELAFDCQSAPSLQQGQPLLASLMVRNLIDNAIKYCPPQSAVKIILTSSQIIVQDNGNGVKEEDLAKLGHRFYRPAGQNEKGSGLGLSIVNRIAGLHHYQFHLENHWQEGEIKGLKAIIDLNVNL